jgi:hypothetical protein
MVIYTRKSDVILSYSTCAISLILLIDEQTYLRILYKHARRLQCLHATPYCYYTPTTHAMMPQARQYYQYATATTIRNDTLRSLLSLSTLSLHATKQNKQCQLFSYFLFWISYFPFSLLLTIFVFYMLYIR